MSFDINKFIKECLERTNYYREIHGVRPLKLNKNISEISQKWCNFISKKNLLKHNQGAVYNGDKLGENLAFNSARGVTGGEMVDQWYNEIKDYNFNRPSFSSYTGHFTQLVWKDSSEVGFGVSFNNGVYLVSNYFPPGNYNNNYSQNVFPANRKVEVKNPDRSQQYGGGSFGGKDFNSYSFQIDNFDKDKKFFGGSYNTSFNNNNNNKTINQETNSSSFFNKIKNFFKNSNDNDNKISNNNDNFLNNNDFYNNNNNKRFSFKNNSRNSFKNNLKTNHYSTRTITKTINGVTTITTIRQTPEGTTTEEQVFRN